MPDDSVPELYSSLDDVTSTEQSDWSRRLICIIGPSGVGKTTLSCALTNQYPDLFRMVGTTSTKHRSAEQVLTNNYHIIELHAFLRLVRSNGFLHWARTKSEYYGVEKDKIRAALSTHRYGIIVMRSRSAHLLKAVLPPLQVFELRASLQILSKRRAIRGDPDEWIARGRTTAAKDLAANLQVGRQWLGHPNGRWTRLCNEGTSSPALEYLVKRVLRTVIDGYD